MNQAISLTRLTTRLLFLIPFAALLYNPSPGLAATAPSLGLASGFAALAGTKVTCTTSTVTGNVGVVLSPPPTRFVNTGCNISGAVHVGDTAAAAAYADFLFAYGSFPSISCDQTLTGTLANVTLKPGVYCFTAGATLTGVLKLNAQGDPNAVWIFKIGTGGTGALTTTSFSVEMIGGGQPCNVYWWVKDAATLTTSNFQGIILAGADITVTGATTFNGDALAGGAGSPLGIALGPTGAVTFTGSTVSACQATGHGGNVRGKCNQGVGNGPEGCDPGNSNNHNPSNDERGGTPGAPGRRP